MTCWKVTGGGKRGACATHQDSAGTQNGCAGMPMAAEAAHLWAFEQGIPASRRDSRAAQLSAAARESGGGSGDVCATHAEGIDGDEHPIGQRDQRHQWYDWNGILRDIVRGERDPEKLARHKHARIRASHQEIARSLEGTWREELLFVVGQSLELYDTYQEKIQLCDQRIDEHLHKWRPKSIRPATRYRNPLVVGKVRARASRTLICADICTVSPA